MDSGSCRASARPEGRAHHPVLKSEQQHDLGAVLAEPDGALRRFLEGDLRPAIIERQGEVRRSCRKRIRQCTCGANRKRDKERFEVAHAQYPGNVVCATCS